MTEAFNHLEDSEAALLELEADPSLNESVDRIFRAFHTIKGVGGFLNLGPICDLAHVSETLLDLLRKGSMQFDSDCGDAILAAIDMMTALLRSLTDGEPPYANALEFLIARIERHGSRLEPAEIEAVRAATSETMRMFAYEGGFLAILEEIVVAFLPGFAERTRAAR